MKNTYWNHNGKYEVVADLLRKKVPLEGAVENARKNKALEKFRKASNCYYDLYNNGLCNRAGEFANVFGIRSSQYRFTSRYGFDFTPVIYERTEVKMDEIVYAAAVEQGLVLHLEHAL